MALKIQRGERAKGEKDFWGFVWPGSASESLVCNALEWQAAEGGGRIIESNRTISVNNPAAIRSWERARNWVGRISPPGVASYREWDALNAFAYSQKAAFFRGWVSDYFLLNPWEKTKSSKGGLSSVPGSREASGGVVRVATLGGFGLGVSESSPHRTEAIEFIRFLLRKEAQAAAKGSRDDNWQPSELFELPMLLKAYPGGRKPGQMRGAVVVTRPSTIAGDKYDAVSKAYSSAVHSVLTGEVKGPEAAAALEKQLTEITGFQTGPPQRY